MMIIPQNVLALEPEALLSYTEATAT